MTARANDLEPDSQYADILESIAEAHWKVVEKALQDEQEVESDG